jgi:hypothetical protein
MTKAEKLPVSYFHSEKFVRNWSAHLGLRLRRRGNGYSLYITYDNCAFPSPRVDCRTLRQVERWLDKWSDDEMARLGPGA